MCLFRELRNIILPVIVGTAAAAAVCVRVYDDAFSLVCDVYPMQLQCVCVCVCVNTLFMYIHLSL